jgi:arylsulfatase A-like enzyme
MNILMILEDALRPDHLGCYGYPKNTSPNIDRLASEGVRFENCIAVSSHTFPPIISILMGQTTATHGLTSASRYDQWKRSKLWGGKKTSLSILAEHGYLIDGELVMRWEPLGFTKDTESRDIENYFEEHRGDKWFFLAEPYFTHLPYNPPEEYYQMFIVPGYQMSEATRKRMEAVRSKLLIHPTGPVSKLEAGEPETLPDDLTDRSHKRTVGIVDFNPEEDKPAVIALYDGEVRVFDDFVGKLVNKLEELGILDNTLIIIVADHGEELFERGHVGHSSTNLMGTLYEESIRVPLIMRYPEALPYGKVIHNQVSQIDIMPTIFEILNLPIPEFMDGQSLLSLINGKTESFREECYAETTPAGWQSLRRDEREIWCLRTEQWKLILYTNRSGTSVEYELYDLKNDPGEKKNLYNPAHPVFKKLFPKIMFYIKKARLVQI